MTRDALEPAPRSGDGAARPSDPTELLLWALMATFEQLALERYAAHAPELATPDKRRFVERLAALGADEAALGASPLGRPVQGLLAHAQSADEVAVLMVQGLILEHLGQAIYRIATQQERASAGTRELAAAGLGASSSVTAAASLRIAGRVGTGEPLYAVFVDASHEVVAALDALAEPVDQIFGEHFGLRFADVMGEFVAELNTACTGLGMQRRKVVAHLAGAVMGL